MTLPETPLVPAVDLVGERISMRPCHVAQASAHCAAVNESIETLGPWMAWSHAEYEEAESRAWLASCEAAWASGEAYEFAIFDADERFAGGCGLNQFNAVHNFANLGYWVRRSRQGQGLAVEAVGLLARFGFETLGLTRIEIVAAAANAPSRRVAEKAGAAFECIARNRLLVRGTAIAAAVYALTPDAHP